MQMETSLRALSFPGAVVRRTKTWISDATNLVRGQNKAEDCCGEDSVLAFD